MATPIGKGHRSLNLTLRKELQVSERPHAEVSITPCSLL